MEINLAKLSERPEQIPNLLKNRGTLLEFWILIIISVIFTWFVVLPKYHQLVSAKAEVETLTQESNKIAEQQAKLKAFISQLDTNSKELTILDEAFPLHPRTTWLYLLIENLANTTGVTLADLSVTNEKEGVVAADSSLIDKPFSLTRSVKKTIVNLQITGGMSQFVAFLSKLESSGRLMDIKSLDIKSSSDNLLDFSLTLEAYYFAP